MDKVDLVTPKGKKTTKMQNPDIQRFLIEWVEKYGSWSESVTPLNKYLLTLPGESGQRPYQISLSSIKQALNPKHRYFLPDFAARIDAAYKHYAETTLPPHKDPKNIKSVAKKFEEEIEYSGSYGIDNEFDEHGNRKRVKVRKTGIKSWVYNRVFPQESTTEQAVMFLIANQLQFLATKDYSSDIKSAIMVFLSESQERFRQELERKGVNLKYLDKDEDK